MGLRHCRGEHDGRNEIDAERVLQRRRIDILGPVHLENGRGIDQRIHAPHPIHEIADPGRVGHVELDSLGRAPGLPDRRFHGARFGSGPVIVDHHMPAIRTQGTGNFGTQALAATGHERDLVRHVHFDSSFRSDQ